MPEVAYAMISHMAGANEDWRDPSHVEITATSADIAGKTTAETMAFVRTAVDACETACIRPDRGE